MSLDPAASAATPDPTAIPREFRGADGLRIAPNEWAERAAHIQESLVADGLEPSATEALSSFRFGDVNGRTWTYDGTAWLVWDGARWGSAAPPASLVLRPFTFEAIPDAADTPPLGVASIDEAGEALPTAEQIASAAAETWTPSGVSDAPSIATVISKDPTVGAVPMPVPAPTSVPEPTSATYMAPAVSPASLPLAATGRVSPPWSTASSPAYRPTHRVPAGGLSAWSRPEPALAAEQRLDPGLDVMLVESFPNGWGRIVCSNTWTGWVDGRLLLPLGPPHLGDPSMRSPPAAVSAPTRGGSGFLDLRSEIGLAALLGLAGWLLAIFVAPLGLRFAVLRNPIPVGIVVAAIVLVLKWPRTGRVLDRRIAAMFLVDVIVATVVLVLFSPG